MDHGMCQPLLFALLLLLSASAPLAAQEPPHGLAASGQLHAVDPKTPRALAQLFRYTGETLPLVSAHRGGALPNFPENCLATFENTIRHTFAITEVDPRYTRDGHIVIHHDETLDRTTNGTGHVADHDLSDLKKLQLKDPLGRLTNYRIPTLDEALKWARGKTILILDQKDVSVKDRIRKLEEHSAESYAMLIVYSVAGAEECYRRNNNIIMEVMITDREQFDAFDKSGVPWNNIVAFVGHRPPRDPELLAMIHAKGACCIAGSSRNLDRELAEHRDDPPEAITQRYRALLGRGVDLIEADLAADVGRLIYRDVSPPRSKAEFFRIITQ
jgi:glycerophosphoryl diester phosphodiesterase